MKTTRLIVSALVGLVLFVAACSPQATPTAVPPPTEAPATEPPAAVPVTGEAVINLGQNETLGSFLVDDKNMTLYLFTKDTPNTSNCYEKCATAWPPLFTTGDPVAGEGVDASLLGTTTRTDGSVQVTYNGWPLYLYHGDSLPGDVNGQGLDEFGGLWYLVSPMGEAIQK